MDKQFEFIYKGGFYYCTKGHADITTNNQNVNLCVGMVVVITPLVLIQNITLSDDFECYSFADDLTVFFPNFRYMANTNIPLYISEHSSWKLTDDEIKYIEFQHNRIEQKKS